MACILLTKLELLSLEFSYFYRINNKKTKIMVSVSDKAAERIIELRKKEGLTEDFNVRVAVEGGGCSGLMYNLDFASELKTTDMVFEDKGVKIMVDKKSILYLAGTELDFSDGLNGKGFQFKNPNASRTCGCGESFSV
jgi:iron-sulfur cluster assembly protein